MTDNPRQIEGLAPREKPPLSRLLKSERVAPTPPPVPSVPADESKAGSPRREPRQSARAAKAATAGRKPSINAYVEGELQQRARATYIQTRNAEEDGSFSDMVAKAIATEVERREALYNGGQPFNGGTKPLRSGRPLSG